MSPPLTEVPMPSDYAALFKAAVDAAKDDARHESHADDILAAVARMSPPQPPKNPWSDWLRSSIIPVVLACIGGLTFYNHDQAATAKSLADLAKNMDVISQRLDRDERDTQDRVKDLVPIIRSNDMAQKQSELIDRQQNDRIDTIAQSILQLRASIETLGQAVAKTHEDMMIDRARRGEKESRLTPPRAPIFQPKDD